METAPVQGLARPSLCALVTLVALPLVAGPASARQPALELGGRVLTQDSQPIHSAHVELFAIGPLYQTWRAQLEGAAPEAVASAQTDADGTFKLAVPHAGMWRVVIAKQGYATAELSLDPLLESQQLRPLVLPPAQEVAVRVVDRSGQPIASAWVQVRSTPPRGRINVERTNVSYPAQLERADARGMARLVVPQGTRSRLFTAAAGYLPSEQPLENATATSIVLDTAVRRSITASRSGGQPVADALVLLEPGRIPFALADGQGHVSIPAPADAPALTEGILLAADGASTILRVSRGEEPLRIVVEPAWSYAGTVIERGSNSGGGDAAGVADAYVWLHDPGTAARSTRDGSFHGQLPRAFLEDPRARIAFQAAARGYLRDAGVATAEQLIGGFPTLLSLERAGRVEGVVVDAEGAAIEGAEISLGDRLRPLGTVSEQRFGRSSADGHFAIGELPLDQRLELLARRRGYSPHNQVLEPFDNRRRQDVTVRLERGHIAYGMVVDENDMPVSGARVSLSVPSPRSYDPSTTIPRAFRGAQAQAVETSAEGEFEVRDIAFGRYDIAVKADGLAPARVPGVLIDETELPRGDDGRLEIGTVTLSPGVAFEGIVTDLDGRPLGDAQVEALTGGSESRSATTGQDGRFTLEHLVEGQIERLHIRRQGYVSFSQFQMAFTEEPQTFKLQPAITLKGVVVDTAGDGIEGARILFRRQRVRPRAAQGASSAIATASSDAKGAFEANALSDGTWSVNVSRRGFVNVAQDGIELLTDTEPRPLHLVLERGATLHGVVRNSDGAPIEGVRLVPAAPEVAFGFGLPRARSLADGSYQLEGLAFGATTVTFQGEGYVPLMRDVVIREGDNTLDVALDAGLEISGRVLDAATGTPLPGARVSARRHTGRLSPERGVVALADAEGRFSISGLERGTYDVGAAHEGYASADVEHPIELAGQAASGVEIWLDHGSVISGRVLGLSDDELSTTQVLAVKVGEQGNTLLARVDYEGAFRIEAVSAGQWRLGVSTRAGRRAGKEVAVGPGGDAVWVEIDLGSGLHLDGTVTNEGVPLASLLVRATQLSGAPAGSANTNQEGRFALQLETGTYHLSVSGGPLAVTYHREIELSADGDIQLEVSLRPITGRVLDRASGAPIAGASVSLHSVVAGAPSRGVAELTFRSRPTTADANGRFELQLPSTGQQTFRIVATHEGYATADLALDPGSVGDLELPLGRAAGLELVVVRDNGVPVAGTRLLLAALDRQGHAVVQGNYTTGAGGRLSLNELSPGAWLLLISEDRSILAASVAVRVTEGAQGDQPTTIALPAGGGLRVAVGELQGTTTSAALQLLDASGQPYRHPGMTDGVRFPLQRGAGLFPSVPAGAWTAVVTASDGREWRGRVAVTSGETAQLEW